MSGHREKRLATYLVQTLVVYASAQHSDIDIPTRVLQFFFLLLEHLVTLPYKVHLMNQEEYSGVGAVRVESCDTVPKVLEVFAQLSGLNVEDINHDADLFEDRAALSRQIRVHEGILPATIPEVQNKVA